jgi:hypothetical protein
MRMFGKHDHQISRGKASIHATTVPIAPAPSEQ